MNSKTSCFSLLAFLLAVGVQTITAAENSNVAVTAAATSLSMLATPAPSSILSGSAVAFSWTAGVGVSHYKLILGTTVGGSDIYNTYTTTATSATVKNLPANGATLYATLYSQIGNTWSSNAYTYTEYTAPSKSVLTSPAPSSTLPSTSATFSWTKGIGVSHYKLILGTTSGGSDIYNTYTTTATSATVKNLPANGATLYATLYSQIGSAWSSNAYTYTESGPALPTAPYSIANNTTYTVANVASGDCVDDTGGATANGTLIEQQVCSTGNANQAWLFTSVGTNSWEITTYNQSGAAWNVAGVSKTAGAGIQLWAFGGGAANMQFQAFQFSSGYAEFVDENSGLCLSLPNSNASQQMQTAACNGSASQSFKLTAVTLSNTPKIVSFTASSTSVPANTLVTLYFTVSGATSITLNQGIGDVTNTTAAFVTPTTPGTVTYTLTATNASGPATASINVKVSAANAVQPTALKSCTFNGPSPICPPYALQSPGGVAYNLWGGGLPWAQQLFWQDVPSYFSTYWQPTGDGYPVPLMNQIGSGVDLYEADGGGTVGGIAYPDLSQTPGYKQYAAWMKTRANLFAMASDGSEPYANQGYITFGMPLDPADWDTTGNWSASNPETFGDWAGANIGKLALQINARGLLAADYFIGINVGTDWNPRLVNRFASWAGVTIPAGSVTQQSNYITQNYNSQWLDFISTGQASYFAAIANTIAAAGKTPMVGGQLPYDPALCRIFADDLRIWSQQFPGKYMYFEVENESQPDRPTPSDWAASYSIGASASLSPDVPIAVYMDGDYSDYWNAVAAEKWSTQHGWEYLKHMTLSAGWTMVANKDGSVRRAAQAFQRGNWDAGTIPQAFTDEMLGHVPTHPFGPALYYSQNVMEYFETPNNETNYYYFYTYLIRGIMTRVSTDYPWIQPYEGVVQGLNLGYWVSDATDPSTLQAADIPSAWLLYDSSHLPTGELAKLQAVAPVYDILLPKGSTQGGSNALSGADLALAAGPIHATGAGLNMLAYIDQNGSVIVMVTNQDGTDQNAGSLVFNNVSNGKFNLIGLLGTSSTAMTVSSNAATVPISVAAYDTIVYEIPALKWIGHITQ